MICPFCQQPVDRFLSSEDGTTGFRCPACGEDGVPLDAGTARGGSLLARFTELLAKKPAPSK